MIKYVCDDCGKEYKNFKEDIIKTDNGKLIVINTMDDLCLECIREAITLRIESEE